MKELKIKVKYCTDCPFSYKEYDDYAIGDDTFVQCSLSQFYNKKEYIIDSYKLIQEDLKYDEYTKQTIPTWCFLRKNTTTVKIEE